MSTLLDIEMIDLTTIANFVEHLLLLKEVLYAPGTMQNFISVSQTRKRGLRARIDEDPVGSTRE